MVGYKTIRTGSQAVLWNRQGEGNLVIGPKSVWVGFGCKLQELLLFAANEHQYLSIFYNDGHREHRAGPCSIFRNPIEHQSVEIKDAIDLNANEVLVLYRKKGDTSEVVRHLLFGPALHVPKEGEWMHEFVWHGSPPSKALTNPEEKSYKTHKVPGATCFTKLRIIPDQFYYNVNDVRTNDEAVITVKLMLFFELKDLVKMLESTHDPIADFINAASADVISWASQRSYEAFLEEAKALNELSSFPQLTSRAAGIGYNITKIVFRGYQATANLQKMNDDSILSRTKLRLQTETEAQEQASLDTKLQRELERSKKRQEMELQEKTHKLEMDQRAHAETLRQREADEAAKLERIIKTRQLELQHKEASDQLEVRRQTMEHELALKRQQDLDAQAQQHLLKLKEMDVDVGRYLIAQYQNPDQVIRIDSGAGDHKPNVHVHAKPAEKQFFQE